MPIIISHEKVAQGDVLILPLSPVQERLWMIDQLKPTNTLNTLLVFIYINKHVDAQLLESALNTLVQRHDALRATFQEREGQPLQVIAPNMHLSLPVIDLQTLHGTVQEAEVLRLETEEAQRPFDLVQGPLVRANLLRLDADKHVLLLSMHQLICDRWSLGTCIQELASFYDALASDQPLPLAEPSLSYVDFLRQQQEWLEGSDADEQLAYWKQQLVELPASLNLPTDRPRTLEPRLRNATYRFAVPQTLSEAVKTLARREQASLDVILVATLQILLYRYSGQEDLVIGTTTANRPSVESEKVVGFFENMLALRSHLSEDLTFRAFLSQVRETIQQAKLHQQIPFVSLLKALSLEHAADRHPLFQVLVTLTPSPVSLPPAWAVARRVIGSGTSLYDLHLNIEERAEGLLAHFEYSTDLFDEATIARMAGHWQMLLQGIVDSSASSEQSLISLPMLTEQERHQLLVEWNTPQIEYFQGQCVHELFELQVERTPETVAVVCEGQQLTYDELNRRANQLAHHLRQLGIQPEVPVGIYVERSLEMIVGLLGILKAGGVHVPLDTAAPAERLTFIAQDTGMPIIVTQRHLLTKFPEVRSQFVCLDSDRATIDQQPATNPTHTVKGEHLAYIVYTSGSTGQPKGVLIEHHSLAAHCEALRQAQGLSADDCCLHFNSFSFDASLEQILPPLLIGARLVVRGPEMWSPIDLLRRVKEHGLTVVSMPCDYWHAVIAQWVADPEQLDGLRLRLVMAGGDRLPPEAVQLWRQSPLRSTRLFNVYGPTEGTITTTIYDIPRHSEQEQPEINIPIGRPLPNRRVYILDKMGQPVPEGVAGELHIGGETLARGYLNRPDLTAERFIPDPFSQQPRARLYKTGDLARYRPGGIIEFLGRVDKQVKIRGYRIELGEIETTIKQHSAVQQAAVFVHDDKNVKRLAAYVVPTVPLPVQEGERLIAQIRDRLKERLPDYMIPSAFVLLEAFPLNTSGKIDQRALPQPDFTASERQEGFVAPRTAQEEMVADVWAQALEIERVGIHDDFFALGGHSLLAMQVVARLQSLFHVIVPLQRFFEGPTVAQLAKTISRLQDAPAQSHPLTRRELVQEGEKQICPVSLTQEGLWFLQQLEPESVAYNIYVALRIHQALDVPALERSLNALVQRHEMLRTTFGKRDGKAVQIIAPSLTLPLVVHDLQALPEQEREAEIRRLASADAQHPFDLAQGPLLRATLFHLAPEEALLLLTTHHIVADGWSLDILLPELCRLYEAFANGQPSPLEDVPFRYADFALWQRELMQEGQFAEQFAYWERQLANLPDALELPMARPRPAQPSPQGATYILTLPQPLVEALKRLSHRQGVTPYMTLLAAFQTLLSRYTGQDDIVVGSVAANRQAETESVVGFFLNNLVLRTDLSGDPGFTDLLARVREVVLAGQAHQELPFASLVKAIRPERQGGRNPLFQVMMNFDTPLAGLPTDWESVDLGNLNGAAQFDLLLEVREAPEHVTCRFEYSTDLFDEATIARLAGHWQTLLRGIVAQPDQALSRLPLLTAPEQRQLLREWNDTKRDYPLDQCLHQLFEAQVERTPDAVAVICEGEQLSYRELNARANQLAHLLREHGVGPEKLVALLSERGIPFLVSMLAVFKAGGAYVPLDPHHPAARLRRVIEGSQCCMVLAAQAFAPTLREALSEVPIEQRPELLYYEERAWADQSEENLPTSNSPHSLAYVIYTSGSTGLPKGAMIEQRGMVNHLYAKIEGLALSERDVVAQTASQCFDISVWQYLSALLVGGSVRIYPDEVAHDPVQLLIQVEQHQVSILETVPSLLGAMLDAEEIKADSRPALSALRWLVPTGEALPTELCWRWLDIYPHVPLLNAYGPTECSDDVTHYPIYEIYDEPRGVMPIGRAIPNMQLYVLDRHQQPLPIGASGELYVGGVGVGRGYLGDEQRTREAFVPDPFRNEEGSHSAGQRSYGSSFAQSSGKEAGARLYKTGDLVRYLPDGSIEFLGRLDFQVKLRGFRIELGEIEAVLGQHPAVRLSVVVAREDAPSEKRLVAYVELHKDQSVTVAELKSHVAAHVPAYMVPSAFLILEKMPLTSNGKIDRRALPAPEPDRNMAEENYVAPQSPLEQQLVQIWEELLSTRPIGITDDFFDLGGDSLLAVRLFDRIAQVCGEKLPLSTLFTGATIEHLARALDAHAIGQRGEAAQIDDDEVSGEIKIEGRAPLVVVQKGGSLPPFFYLHGEWKGGGLYSRELARRQGPEQPFYLLEPYKFDERALPPTFEEMAAAHFEVMRRVQPEGPYFLSGYCNGALIAYEIARQMHAQGVEVGLLLLMDPDFPARHGFVRKIIKTAGKVLHAGEQKQFEWYLCLQHVYRYLRFAHYRRTTDEAFLANTGKKGMSAARKLQALLPRVKTLRQDWSNVYDWLVANYRPSDQYPGKIVFFWTSEEPWRSGPWQPFMEKNRDQIEVYLNPGNHISGRTQYLPVLAERLNMCLKKAQATVKR